MLKQVILICTRGIEFFKNIVCRIVSVDAKGPVFSQVIFLSCKTESVAAMPVIGCAQVCMGINIQNIYRLFYGHTGSFNIAICIVVPPANYYRDFSGSYNLLNHSRYNLVNLRYQITEFSKIVRVFLINVSAFGHKMLTEYFTK